MIASIERALTPRTILVIGFAIFLIYAYPGYTSIDSAVQLGEARTQQYSDGHPPAMAALWRVVELFIVGSAGMLLLQGSLFLIGTYLLLRRHFAERSAAIAACAILLFPPVFATMAVIWKDSQMAAFLMLGIGLVGSPGPWRRPVGVVAIGFAIAMRHNALVAAFPILVLLFVWRADQRGWKRIAMSTALWVAASGAALTTNRLLTRVHDHAWHYSVGPMDIIGVLYNSSKSHSDNDLLETLDGTPLVPRDNIASRAKQIYNPALWWGIMNGPRRLFDWPQTEDQRGALARAWQLLVLEDPLAYVHHRLRVFRLVLGLTDKWTSERICNPVWRERVTVTRTASEDPSSSVQTAIGDGLDWFADHTPIYRPYIYFLLALIFLWPARRERDVLALLASGLLYELTLLPLAPSPETRYSHWMIVCTAVATVILVKRRMANRPRELTVHALRRSDDDVVIEARKSCNLRQEPR